VTVRIGLHSNCQIGGLTASLRALLPDAVIVAYPMARNLPPEVEMARAAELSACDHLLTIGAGDEHGRLSTAALHRTARHLLVLPGFAFSGFHPDQCYVRDQGRELASVTGGYQSRIAIAGYLGGLSVPDTVRLYNQLVFSRLGYFAAYAEQCVLLAESWSRFGMDAPGLLAGWRERGCFAHTGNHPKIFVLLDMARGACARMGITPGNPDVDADTLPDNLARGPLHPVFPEIARAIGVAPEGCFSAGIGADGERAVFSPAEFVQASFHHFGQVPEAALLATPGVAQALAALDLARVPRPPRRRAGGPGMALLSFHGTVLLDGAVPGQIRHVPLPEAAGGFVTVDTAGTPAGALAGCVLHTGETPDIVHVTREGRFLCADRNAGLALFDRGTPGDWEGFLPVSQAELATLRTILGSDWLNLASGETVRRALIRLGDGFRLVFGRWTVDLRTEFPRWRQAASELTLILEGEPSVLRAVAPSAALAPSIALAPGGRLVLAGAPAWLPPPVTASDRDRRWLYHAARDAGAANGGALNGRAQPAEAVLRRGRDKVVWGDGAGPALPGVSVRFCAPGAQDGFAWMEAALRLQVLTAVVPPEAVFLLPADVPEAAVQAWGVLGFGSVPFVRVPQEGCLAADLIWLDGRGCGGLPAEAMAGLRGRIGTPPAASLKLFFQAGVAPEVAPLLEAEGFRTVPAGSGGLTGHMAAMAQAAWVVAASRQAMPVFCPHGARFLELAPEGVWGGDDWMMSVKQGVMHGVLPCRPGLEGVAPDPGSLAGLLQVMVARS
jgi:hypothetical protein